MRFQRSRSSEGQGDRNRRNSSRCPHPEEGSEVVANILVQVLIVALFLAMTQLALTLHVRNSATHAAGEGARRGALLGGDVAEASERTRSLIGSLPGAGDARIDVSRTAGPQGDVLTVTVRTTLPLVASLGPRSLTVHGSALVEEEPDG